MEDYRFKGNVNKRLDELTEAVHTLQQELEKALKDVKELKRRVSDDDGK